VQPRSSQLLWLVRCRMESRALPKGWSQVSRDNRAGRSSATSLTHCMLVGVVGAVMLPIAGVGVGCAQIVRGGVSQVEAIGESSKGKVWDQVSLAGKLAGLHGGSTRIPSHPTGGLMCSATPPHAPPLQLFAPASQLVVPFHTSCHQPQHVSTPDSSMQLCSTQPAGNGTVWSQRVVGGDTGGGTRHPPSPPRLSCAVDRSCGLGRGWVPVAPLLIHHSHAHPHTWLPVCDCG
jgi:hypothetical protein